MLNGSPARGDATDIGNVENSNPISLVPSGGGVNKARRKKGGKKPRSTAALHRQRRARNTVRLSDHNNNNNNSSSNNTSTSTTLAASSANKPAAQMGTEPPASAQTPLARHHLKQGAKKELLKSKGGRLDRATAQPGGQPARNHLRHDQITQSHKPKQAQTSSAAHSTKKKGITGPSNAPPQHQPAVRQQKKPLHVSNNVKTTSAPPAEAAAEYLKDGDKVYAGAKFSEPPSPSVLPKPPSHWVGENEPQQSNQSREQMTFHLKSLLKVTEKS